MGELGREVERRTETLPKPERQPEFIPEEVEIEEADPIPATPERKEKEEVPA